MGGQRYYTFRGSSGGVAKLTQGGVRFFMLDSNYMDKAELDWIAKELGSSGSDWKIAVFHHPLYSSGGRHGSSLDLRAILEPLLVQGGVNVVFTGHDHVYERVKPRKASTTSCPARADRSARATSTGRPGSPRPATTATSRSC